MKRILIFIGIIFMTIYSYGQTKIISTDVNFRNSPGITGQKICLLPKGTIVTVVQDSVSYGTWTKIKFQGKIGYVSGNFLENTSDSRKVSDNHSSSQGVKYYINSNGEKVQSPTHYSSAPSGATAECQDGTYSFSTHRRGTCSRHGGVKRWLH